jgi:5-methylcytosine-specific restriction protein A
MARCCEYPRCSRAPTRANYCRAHYGTLGLEARDRQRAAPYQTEAWQQRRAQVLREEPVCRTCRRRRSRMVDHLVERRDGGTDDRSNLQGLCWPCHSRKTATRTARGPQPDPGPRNGETAEARDATEK